VKNTLWLYSVICIVIKSAGVVFYFNYLSIQPKGMGKCKSLGESVHLIFFVYSQNEREIENKNFCV